MGGCQKMRSVCLIGKDNVNWSVDQDRNNFERALKELEYPLRGFSADTFLLVWWSYALSKKYQLLKKIFPNKTWIGVITDDLYHQEKQFLKCNKVIDFWIYANTYQKEFLKDHRISENNMFYCPFYVNEKVFKDSKKTRMQLCKTLDIPYSKIKDRFLIGSFQRDSLGTDLTKQKWQKNPELLIKILKDLDGDKFVLVLAGPRRHYIINKCIRNNIPYIFIGDNDLVKKNKDDIKENTLNLSRIALLYNLIDLYIVTSKSEGGPKAIIESSISKKSILSTVVGMAPDLLIKESLCYSKQEFVSKIERLIKDPDFKKKIINENYKRVSKINNWRSFKKRVDDIICKAKK